MLRAASVWSDDSRSGDAVTNANNRNFRPFRVPILAMMFRRGTIHFVVACALVAPSAAVAQEPAQVDPDSPAGVEYKLPLDQARRDAAPDPGGGGRGGGPRSGGGGGPQSGGGSGDPAPLFGAGITRVGAQGSDGGNEAMADASDRGGGQESADSDDSGAAGVGGGDAAGPGAGESGRSFSTTAASAADSGGSTGLVLGGIALAVVVVGGALGLALRRGLRTTAAS